MVQGDPSGWLKPPVDLNLGYSVTLPRQWVVRVVAHQLLELSELSQQSRRVTLYRVGQVVVHLS